VGRVQVDNQGLRLWCDVRNRRQKLKGEDIVVKDRALEFDQSSSGTKEGRIWAPGTSGTGWVLVLYR
jgi:hypothetical protein